MSYILVNFAILVILKLSNVSVASPVYDMQPAFLVPGIGLTNGRNIRNLPCVSRKNNKLNGVCMFAIDCYKANGTHLGTCVDRFYFGSCCHIQKPINHEDLENTIENENVIILDNREPPQRKQNTTIKGSTKKPALKPTKVPIIETTQSNKIQNTTTTTSKLPLITTSTTTSKPVPSTTSRTTIKPKPTKTSSSKPRPTQRPSFRPSSKPSTKPSSKPTSKPTTKPTRKPTTTTTKPSIIKPSTKQPTIRPTPSHKPAIIQTTTSNISKTTTVVSSTTTKRPLTESSTVSHQKVENVTVKSTTVKPTESSSSSIAAVTLSTLKPGTSTASNLQSATPSIFNVNLTQISTTTTTANNNTSTSTSISSKQPIESTTPRISTSTSSSTTMKSTSESTTQTSMKPTTTVTTTTTKKPTKITSFTTSPLSTSTAQLVENPVSFTVPASSSIVTSTVTSSTTTKPVIENTTTYDTNFGSSSTVRVNGTTSDAIINTEGSGIIFSTITTTDGWILLPNVTPTISTETVITNVSTSTSTIVTPLINTTDVPNAGNISSTTNIITSTALSSTISTTEVPDYNKGINMSDFTDVCGRRLWPQGKIVGGEKSSFGRWPWQISLRQWRTSTYLHKCGAALLNENWAITAAHCVDNVPPSDLLLRLGEHDLSNEEDEPYLHEERRVQIVASHPNFDPRTFEYDLALLRFYEPVDFRPNILPICVPANDENFVGRTAHVTGWGRLYEDGPLPSVLQEVSVPIVNNSVCETMYKMAGYVEHIPEIFICAGWRKGGFDSCEGDSGGPLVIQREDKRFLLAGIISWGIGCAEPNQPGVYTRISQFRVWINKILQF